MIVEGTRRRTTINYAEAAGGGGQKTGDMILATLAEHDPDGSKGVDLPEVAEGVYQRGDAEGMALPFVGVRLALKARRRHLPPSSAELASPARGPARRAPSALRRGARGRACSSRAECGAASPTRSSARSSCPRREAAVTVAAAARMA